MIASPETFPLLAELLADQQRLDTPVARFADAYANGTLTSFDRERAFPQLIPLTAPQPGEQYAFEVDLDACTGCKACVAACHSLNGLDDDETWRDVGLLVSSDRRHPFSQTITTACHHCADPACLNGCPVLAYEKDPVTGIVRHLDDQCIGCSYCVLKCPYDVPKYSKRRGIVRKCDMCHGRLAHGEAPACAQACPTHAIKIVVVRTKADGRQSEAKPSVPALAREPIETQNSDPAVAAKRAGDGFLPGAPDPSYTQPTTRYVSRRRFPPNVAPADAASLRPQSAHWPLVVLLIFMALATGSSLIVAAGRFAPAAVFAGRISSDVTWLGWIAGTIGLAGSVLHLGQPRRAWRIFLGLRRSWLSREAMVFGVWYVLATVLAAKAKFAGNTGLPSAALSAITAAVAIAGIMCSAMIYADTRREFWRIQITAPRFVGSAIVLGLASALACSVGLEKIPSTTLAVVLGLAVGFKLMIESQALAPLNGDRDTLTPSLKTARLLVGPLRSRNELRIACGIGGGILLPACAATQLVPDWMVWPAFATVLIGELLERSLYFRAVAAPKMPGVPE